MLVSLIPVLSPSFPSLAVQALTQLPIACSTGPCPASHRLQCRPSPSFPSLAVQALAQLPIACSPGPHPASHRLQYRPSPSFPSLAVSSVRDWERGYTLVGLFQSPCTQAVGGPTKSLGTRLSPPSLLPLAALVVLKNGGPFHFLTFCLSQLRELLSHGPDTVSRSKSP